MSIPPRAATDAYLAKMHAQLDIVFDVDLGELVRGHHVVARGITFGRATEPELHYEFVPGMDLGEGQRAFDWYWMMYASDDVGTGYADFNGGAFDPEGDGAASHGTRDIGGEIPPEASRLTLRFEPPEDWVPPEPWRREIVIDLRDRRLAR